MDSMEIDDLVTKVDFQRRKQPSRRVSVCLGLLCAVLLAGIIGQFIYYEKIYQCQGDRLQDSYEASTAERKQLETKLSNLMEEKGQLQQSYTALTTERDEFKANNRNLQREKEECQTLSISLRENRDQLQSNYNSLVKVKDELEKEIIKLRVKPCQRGWRRFEESCYFVSTEEKNWASSRADCIAKGADLVIINSRAEQVFVNGLLTTRLNAWIGLTDSATEGTWMWVDGTPATTTYWSAGQPNNSGGDPDCGETLQRSSGVGEWNDEVCSLTQKFICEQYDYIDFS